MSRVVYGVVALVLALQAPVRAEVRLLQPTSGERMSLTVTKQARQYFRIASGDSTGVDVTGPGELKFIVRAIPRSPAAATVSYRFIVLEDGRALKTVRTRTTPIATRWKGKEETATHSRSATLVVPRGKHRFTVKFDSKDATAAGIRYVFRDASETHVPLQATGGRETVVLVVKEKPWDYHIADPLHPVEVDVIGPTRLRAVSRLVFANGARGNQNYGVKVEMDGKPIAENSFVTTKSAVVDCEVHADWIVGKSKPFYIDIPKGSHHLILRPAGNDAPTVALRLSIPNKDTRK